MISTRRIPPDQSVAFRPQGPDPIPAHVPAEALTSARKALVTALQQREPLHGADTALLLMDTVQSTRELLMKMDHTPEGTAMEGAEVFSPAKMGGHCSPGQAATYYRLAELGIPPQNIFFHQAARTLGKPGEPPDAVYAHGFLTARMPDGKLYLIDTTFRQFCSEGHGGPGKFLAGSPEGQKLADQLLAHGFVELTDANAQLYGQALRKGAPDKIDPADFSQSTGVIDWERGNKQMQALPRPTQPDGTPAAPAIKPVLVTVADLHKNVADGSWLATDEPGVYRMAPPGFGLIRAVEDKM